MPETADFSLDRQRLKMAARSPEALRIRDDFILREASERLLANLQLTRVNTRRVLDLGCGSGHDQKILTEHFKTAEYYGLDWNWHNLPKAPPTKPWQRLFGQSKSVPDRMICSDAEKLAIASQTLDVVWSNMLLHWLIEPKVLMTEVARCLRPEGLFIFSCLGPDSLQALRQALGVDANAHIHQFIDMHDLGDALSKNGFASPVMEMQMLNLSYARVEDIIRDLRNSGSFNASNQRRHGLSGKTLRQRLFDGLEAQRCEGKINIRLELIFGHAWRTQPKTTATGEQIIQFNKKSKE